MFTRRAWLWTGVVGSGGGPAFAEDRLHALLANPPASGLIVVQTVRDSPAAKRGVREGDILQTYAGTRLTTIQQLLKLIDEHERSQQTVALGFFRNGKAQTQQIDAGVMGVRTARVEAGRAKWKPSKPQPYQPDLSGLNGEAWMSYQLAGRRAGFEWVRFRPTAEGVTSEYKLAFLQGDYEERFHVVIETEKAGPGRFRTLRYVSGAKQNQVVEARRQSGRFTGTRRGKPEALSATAAVVPSYAIGALATTLPLREGFLTAFAVFEEANFRLQPGHELVCARRERLDVLGQSVETYVFEDRHYGEPGFRYWVDAKRRLVRTTWGSHTSVLTQKDTVLRTLPSRLADFAK